MFAFLSVGVDKLVALGERMLFFAGEGFGYLFSPLGEANPFGFYLEDNTVDSVDIVSWVGRGVDVLVEIVSLGML